MQTLYKFPSEARTYAFDFSLQPEIVAGETLTGSPTITSTRTTGTGTLTVGAAAIVGTKVTSKISAGTNGDVFKLLCTVTTSGSHTLQARALLLVQETD